jgi:glycosyltransferase involved in cell wall biosynthesis
MSKIGIDVSTLATPNPSGIARYVHSLLGAMAELDTEDEFFLCYRLSRLRRYRHFRNANKPNFPLRLFQDGFSPLLARSLDLFHGPDDRIATVGNVPMVATVHDMFSFDYPEFSSARFRAKKEMYVGDCARRSKLLIFDSSDSRDQFTSRFPVDDSRLRVIPLGVNHNLMAIDAQEAQARRDKLKLPAEYLLMLGINPRKNYARVLEAYSLLPKDSPTLVLAGALGSGVDSVHQAIARLDLSGRVIVLGSIAEQDVGPIYLGASLLVFPSISEGFGLPVLEAFVCGTPVLTSSTGALPETAGDAALLVDPLSVEAISEGILRVLEDSQYAYELSLKGKARAQLFTWQKTAKLTLAAYQDAMQG